MPTRLLAMSLGAVLVLASAALPDDPADDNASTTALTLTEPIACRTIKGYDDYVALDEPELTKDEKLLIYLRPRQYHYNLVDDHYTFHLVEDVKIRRKDQKKVLWGQQKVLDYTKETEEPPLHIYLGTTIGLKKLTVGEYTAELIVHDLLRDPDDPEATATQTLEFRIIPRPPDK